MRAEKSHARALAGILRRVLRGSACIRSRGSIIAASDADAWKSVGLELNQRYQVLQTCALPLRHRSRTELPPSTEVPVQNGSRLASQQTPICRNPL